MLNASVAVSSPTKKRLQLSSLTLYATASPAAIDHVRLIEHLESLQLIARPLSETQFLAGERFFHYITFLGCSPAIPLLPEQGEHYIRISVPRLDKPQLFYSLRAHPPLCPACKAPLADWKQTIQMASEGQIECESCQYVANIDQLHFRKRACYAQAVIRIEPVFESEAIPDTALLTALATEFGGEFKYAYT